MGQKVHPYGFRLGFNKTWRSRWFADRDYAKLLHEDLALRADLKKRFAHAGVAKIETERAANKLKIDIHTSRPGIIIGRKGTEVEKLKAEIQKRTNREVFINIQEIQKPELDAQLIAESVAMQLEKRVAFRRAMRKAVESALRFGARGIKVRVSGRLNGAEIARSEWYLHGQLPLQTLRADIDYGFAEANTTYGQIGIAAPILLVILRLFQGFSAGGEWAGAAAFLVEYAPPGRRGFIGSWQQVSVGGGFLLGSTVATLLASIMSPESLAGWGWRIPFLSGLVMTVIGLYLRLAIDETPKFRAIQKAGQVADAPIAEAFGKHGKRLLTVVGFTLSGTVAYYVFLAYFPTYVSTVLKLPLRTASSVNTIGLILFLIMVPFLGVLSDRIGRRPLLLAHAAAAAILAYPLFLLMESRSFGAILIAQIIGVAIQGLFSGAAVAGYVEMFPTRIRYTAISVPYNITVAAFGGTAPFIATYLVSTTGNHLSFTYYLMAAGIISFLTYLLVVKETCWSELQ